MWRLNPFLSMYTKIFPVFLIYMPIDPEFAEMHDPVKSLHRAGVLTVLCCHHTGLQTCFCKQSIFTVTIKKADKQNYVGAHLHPSHMHARTHARKHKQCLHVFFTPC